ncbi:TadE family protein [Undibacterium sp. Dicai25W]|uniref:TadE family protein n=1 Tax=Undibacterium sp. Dicai25W TaxID=3413034 RepID=UPI003BF317A6
MKLTPFRGRPHKDAWGATTIEFYVVAFWILIPLIMAILQMGMFIVAKNTVNLATFSAARAGAASGGDAGEMRRSFLNALSPLYVARGLGALGGSGLKEVTKGNFAVVMPAALASAAIDWAMPMNSLKVLNPSSASFKDFAIQNSHGSGKIIPVSNLIKDTTVGSASQQTRADALLLKIEVTYCYEMVFPMIDEAVGKILEEFSTSLSDRACYARKPPNNRRGIPIVAQAVVRMTTPPLQSNF